MSSAHLRSSPARRGASSPARKPAAAAASAASFVPGAGEVVLLSDSAVPVQQALQAFVGYRGRTAAPPPALAAMLAHIAGTCSIPDDFELDKTKYGPLSGLTFEDRLVSAYERGLLPLKSSSPTPAARSAPGTPARRGGSGGGPSTPLGARTSAAALDVTPARAEAEGEAAAAAKPRRVLCADCGGEGHWRWECSLR